jgi:hypothetical protein
MAEPVLLRYYECVFHLLGREPRVSADALRVIER